MSCRNSGGEWSPPSFVTITGGSWGLQIGVEGVDLVVLVMNDQGFQHLLLLADTAHDGYLDFGIGELRQHGIYHLLTAAAHTP